MVDAIIFICSLIGGTAVFLWLGRRNVKKLGEPYIISPQNTKRRQIFSGAATLIVGALFTAHYFITDVQMHMFFQVVIMFFFGLMMSAGINTLIMVPAKVGVYENGVYGTSGGHLYESIESVDFDYPLTSSGVAIMNISKHKGKFMKPNVVVSREDAKKIKKYINGKIKEIEREKGDDDGSKFSYANIKNLKP